jgi:hypothetical protein
MQLTLLNTLGDITPEELRDMETALTTVWAVRSSPMYARDMVASRHTQCRWDMTFQAFPYPRNAPRISAKAIIGSYSGHAAAVASFRIDDLEFDEYNQAFGHFIFCKYPLPPPVRVGDDSSLFLC